MQELFSTILVLALISAITPGPLFTLVISETLKHGKANGIKIALAPFLTDLPIMLASIFVLSKLAHLNYLFGLISLFGACFLAYLAYGSITTKSVHLETKTGSNSILKGMIANFLNPNPYIFYFSIMSPLIVKAMNINFIYGPLSVFLFLGVFVLGMIVIVLFVHSAKNFFTGKAYIYLIRLLGLALLFFSFSFLRDSLKFFGII